MPKLYTVEVRGSDGSVIQLDERGSKMTMATVARWRNRSAKITKAPVTFRVVPWKDKNAPIQVDLF